MNYIEMTRGALGTVWMHQTQPMYIVKYDAIDGIRQEFYQAYKAVDTVPRGRMPWTVNNRRIGHIDHGYKTLADAKAAIDKEATP